MNRDEMRNTNRQNEMDCCVIPGAEKKILVVDDAKVNRNILKKILKRDGFATEEAQNGQEALDILMRDNHGISLVLLDLAMPVMDGYTLLDKMNEVRLLTSVPVIITTGSDQGSAEISSLEHGATDFITKPYNPDVVCHRVRSILRLRENAALLSRVETDRLTGLYSREFFYSHAERFVAEHPDSDYDIWCGNIENFKVVNAKYGMEVGDELLKYVAEYVKSTINEKGVCGRLGADSFVALRIRQEYPTQNDIGRRISEALSCALVRNISVQYGICPVDDKTLPISSVCDRAQLALSTIKHKYGLYYAVYDDSMRQRMMREHQLTNYMEQALSECQFKVYLQPKHDIVTGDVAGAEALVRWVHPDIGFISPGEFIPLFERNGFVTKLDKYVWEEVCRTLRRWLNEGRKTIPVSVNVSRADFDTDNLIEKIEEMVDSYEIPHELIHFEVTESAYTDNPQKIISAVSTLRDIGFLIEMDDFGSGYSSLNMLSELPIDILKLDMRFVQKGDTRTSAGRRSILSFIISLSKWLQLPTIAEGVETKEDVELLKAMGCNYIQGYYFAKPMPIADFEIYMDRQITHIAPDKVISRTRRMPSFVGEGDLGEKPLILVVEDIEGNRELLDIMLSPFYTVAEAENGEKAFALIKEHHNEISCIILDLLMPVMDGFKLLDLMRDDGYLDEIPVIITTESGADSELRALHLGADSFVAKPYNEEILLHHVEKEVKAWEYRRLYKTRK